MNFGFSLPQTFWICGENHGSKHESSEVEELCWKTLARQHCWYHCERGPQGWVGDVEFQNVTLPHHFLEGECHRFHSGKIRLPWQQPAIVGKIRLATVLGESLILLVLERVDCPKCGQQSTHRDSARNCDRYIYRIQLFQKRRQPSQLTWRKFCDTPKKTLTWQILGKSGGASRGGCLGNTLGSGKQLEHWKRHTLTALVEVPVVGLVVEMSLEMLSLFWVDWLLKYSWFMTEGEGSPPTPSPKISVFGWFFSNTSCFVLKFQIKRRTDVA